MNTQPLLGIAVPGHWRTQDAVLSFSGGQDSTTCLLWALQVFDTVHLVSFLYGQKHEKEIDAVETILREFPKELKVKIGVQETIDLDSPLIGSSPLVNPREHVQHYAGPDHLPGGIEKTFVPGRNALFAVIMANRAAAWGARHLVMGICEEDYGGYPDCRESFARAAEEMLSSAIAGNFTHFTMHAPLMNLTKAATVRLAACLPGWEMLGLTHTCYEGQFPPCLSCHSCLLRMKGFHDAGMDDPLIVRAKRVGLLEDRRGTGMKMETA